MEPHSYECGNKIILTRTTLTNFWLQWSRTLTSAEMRTVKSGTPLARGASMEPHSYECGNRTSARKTSSTNYGFNGAALLRVRKSVLIRPAAGSLSPLQWSRTLTSAEMTNPWSSRASCFGFNGAALLRVRKFGKSTLPITGVLSFNGAALLRVRKSAKSTG